MIEDRILAGSPYKAPESEVWPGTEILVKRITPSRAATIRRTTKGLLGREWMVKSILEHGEIRDDKNTKERKGK